MNRRIDLLWLFFFELTLALTTAGIVLLICHLVGTGENTKLLLATQLPLILLLLQWSAFVAYDIRKDRRKVRVVNDRDKI